MSIRPIRSAPVSPSNLVHQDPSRLRDHFFGSMESEFNRFFDEFFAVQRKPLSNGFPRVDVYEHAGNFVVEYSMAGVDPDNISIEINEDPESTFREFGTRALKVAGKMSSEFEHKKDASYHVKELTRKHFTRTMILPDYVKSDPVASYKNGMLTLVFSLPETEATPQPKVTSIPIKVEGGK